MKRKKGFFSISAVAEMFSVHQQTIRLYEREGLIAPKRSDGNTRLFSEEDVDRLEEIIHLTHKVGVNLAGVQIILKLQKQLQKMQKDMNAVFEETTKDLKQQEIIHTSAVKTATKQLANFKKTSLTDLALSTKTDKHNESDEETDSSQDGWKIEYEQE
jgi:MerR family transcriptional regulator/heat shock protein HspR